MLDPKTLAAGLRMIADGLDLLAGVSSEAVTAATKAVTKPAAVEDDEPKKSAPARHQVDDEEDEAPKAKKAAPADEDDEDEKPKSKKAAKDEDEDDEDEQPKKAASSKKSGGDEVTLPQLQELAAQLLASGQRRTLKSILDEVGVKSLSTADPSTYGELLEKLNEAVEGMDLT